MLDVLVSKPRVKGNEKGVYQISGRADKPVKSAIKAVSWRIVGTIDTMIISFFITGKLTLALSIGTTEVLTKTVLYYFHERIWAHVHSINFKRWMVRRRRFFKPRTKSNGLKAVKQSA